MQYFKDAETGQEWHFEDDVQVIKNEDGSLSFVAAHGLILQTPTTLRPRDEIPDKKPKKKKT